MLDKIGKIVKKEALGKWLLIKISFRNSEQTFIRHRCYYILGAIGFGFAAMNVGTMLCPASLGFFNQILAIILIGLIFLNVKREKPARRTEILLSSVLFLTLFIIPLYFFGYIIYCLYYMIYVNFI